MAIEVTFVLHRMLICTNLVDSGRSDKDRQRFPTVCPITNESVSQQLIIVGGSDDKLT